MGIGAAMAGSSLIGGLGSMFGGIMGSQAQTEAAEKAMQMERQMFEEGRGDLMPYMNFGGMAGNQLMTLLGLNGNSGAAGYGSLMKNFDPTMEQLEKTPGYQFAKTQGLEATQNGYAARGLGASGNAMRGAANYAEGLASNTYQQQFQDYWAQNQNKFNMLADPMHMGAGAAAASAGNAMSLGQMLGQNSMAIGNAQAGMWNNIGAGIGQIGQAPMGYAMGNMYGSMMGQMANGGYNSSGTWGAPTGTTGGTTWGGGPN